MHFSQKDFKGLSDIVNIPIKLIKPDFHITHQILDQNNNGIIEQGESVDLIVRILNAGNLDAENVTLDIDINNPGVILTGSKTIQIGRIAAATSSVFKYFLPSVSQPPCKRQFSQKNICVNPA